MSDTFCEGTGTGTLDVSARVTNKNTLTTVVLWGRLVIETFGFVLWFNMERLRLSLGVPVVVKRDGTRIVVGLSIL